jgi:hypothetical protein
MSVQSLIADPRFAQLPADQQKQALAAVDARFANLSDQDFQTFIHSAKPSPTSPSVAVGPPRPGQQREFTGSIFDNPDYAYSAVGGQTPLVNPKTGDAIASPQSQALVASIPATGFEAGAAISAGKLTPFLLKAAGGIAAGSITDHEVTKYSGSPFLGGVAGLLASGITAFGENKIGQILREMPEGKIKNFWDFAQYLSRRGDPASKALTEQIKADPSKLFEERMGRPPQSQEELFQAKKMAQQITAPVPVQKPSGVTGVKPRTGSFTPPADIPPPPTATAHSEPGPGFSGTASSVRGKTSTFPSGAGSASGRPSPYSPPPSTGDVPWVNAPDMIPADAQVPNFDKFTAIPKSGPLVEPWNRKPPAPPSMLEVPGTSSFGKGARTSPEPIPVPAPSPAEAPAAAAPYEFIRRTDARDNPEGTGGGVGPGFGVYRVPLDKIDAGADAMADPAKAGDIFRYADMFRAGSEPPAAFGHLDPETGRVSLTSGDRRVAAAQQAGATHLPVAIASDTPPIETDATQPPLAGPARNTSQKGHLTSTENKVKNLAEYFQSKGIQFPELDRLIQGQGPDLRQHLNDAKSFGQQVGNPVPKTGYKGLDYEPDFEDSTHQQLIRAIRSKIDQAKMPDLAQAPEPPPQ